MIKNQEQLIKLRDLFGSVFTKNYPLEIEMVDTSQPLKPEVYKNIINKSLVLNRFSETLKSLNYRGFVSPYSQYVIYTSHMCLSDIQRYIFQSSEIPFTHFAIIYSRNIINKPVDLNALNMAMNIKSPVIVFGPEAIEDYSVAGNCLPKVDCTSFPQFIENIKAIK
jgi:hypothetical protein